MIQFIRRCWRWVFNPLPIPGQVWRLEHFGPVLVLDVRLAVPLEQGMLQILMLWPLARVVQFQRINGSVDHSCGMGQFRSQAYPNTPKLVEWLKEDT